MHEKHTLHVLKCWPEFFAAIREDLKIFEIRKNDRNYCEGDVLLLKEFTHQGEYTGRHVLRYITYITDFEQKPGHVVMSLTD